jgi:hypothetical protein
MKHKDATGWTLDVQTYQVQQCLVDYAFGLRLDDVGPTRAESVFVRISAPFELFVNSERCQLDAEQHPELLGPALTLHKRFGATAAVSVAGDLRLTFADGAYLSVTADPRYEAWELGGPFGLLICLPGGGVADFPPPPARTDQR